MTPRPLLRHGSDGADVERLQQLLNRGGALLKVDGDYGPATEKAVIEAQRRAGLAVSGEADEPTWSRLEEQPAPSADLPTETVTFIIAEEVGGREFYEWHTAVPHDPGVESGVTIGIGYDLRFKSADELRADWGAELADEHLRELSQHVGRKADAAAIAALSHIRIPFFSAWTVFIGKTLPEFVARSRAAFAGFDALPPLCRGALVSLVYNRGESMNGERRREMRAIRDHIVRGDLDRVAGEFVAMKRLWPDSRGLQGRRDKEAELWTRGLQGGHVA